MNTNKAKNRFPQNLETEEVDTCEGEKRVDMKSDEEIVLATVTMDVFARVVEECGKV